MLRRLSVPSMLLVVLSCFPLVGHSGEFGAQGFLAKDKVIVGLDGGGFFSEFIGLHMGGSLIFVDENAPSKGVGSIFLGGMLELHLQGRFALHRNAEIRVGMGVDIWSLWSIDGDEVLFGLPALVEGRFFLSPQWAVYGRARYYLTSSENMRPGEDFEGEESVPVLLSVGIGRHF